MEDKLQHGAMGEGFSLGAQAPEETNKGAGGVPPKTSRVWLSAIPPPLSHADLHVFVVGHLSSMKEGCFHVPSLSPPYLLTTVSPTWQHWQVRNSLMESCCERIRPP
ncbi:unnamed protein product [Boreogadus saida]